MKHILVILISCFACHLACANYVETYLLEGEEIIANPNQGRAANMTRDALMQVDGVQERADYFVYQIKKLTFGEYTDDVLIITPFITGDLQFTANDINFYYNHFQNRGGVEYNINF